MTGCQILVKSGRETGKKVISNLVVAEGKLEDL